MMRKFIRKIAFADISPIIHLGLEKVLDAKDMPALPKEISPRHVPMGMATLPLDGPWKFLFGILWVLRGHLVGMISLISLLVVLELIGPWLIRDLVGFIETMQPSDSIRHGLGLAVLLCLVSISHALTSQHYVYQALLGIQKVINGLNKRIYDHALGLSRKSRQKYPTGDVVNFMGTDSNDVSEFLWIGVELTFSIVTIVSVITMLLFFLGPAAWAGVVILVLISPATIVVARKFSKLDSKIMDRRDERVTMISQVLNGIRIVKYFAWSPKILGQVRKIRDQEVKARKQLAWTGSWSLLFYISVNTAVCVSAFATHIWLGNTLDAATVFSCLALFRLLEHPFGNMTHFIAEIAASKVGADRIREFLSEEAVQGAETVHWVSPANEPVGFKMEGLSAKFEDAEKSVLEKLNLEVKPGESVAIVGPVGAGKSSLLLAALGEVPIVSGHMGFTGIESGQFPRMAYVPQEAFVMNGSLRENIEFGSKDGDINMAIHTSCMAHDLKLFGGGLDTEIGEHGVNLSGGQKQRVGLARAVMAQPGLVLLDDPLSAVDVRTEDLLIERLLFGIWNRVTRVCVTHRLKYLNLFDHVLFIEDGKVVAHGSYEDILAKSQRFNAFVADHLRDEAAEAVAMDDAQAPNKQEKERSEDHSRITVDEDRENGAVESGVYFDYLRALGGRTTKSQWILVPLLILATLLVAAIPILQNTWLSLWTNESGKTGADEGGFFHGIFSGWLGSDLHNVGIFGAIGATVLILYFLQHLLWATRAVEAGKDLHDRALKSVLSTNLRFFDSTPVGRILNRFSRDVDSVERNLAWSFEHTVRAVFHTLGAVVVMATVIPAIFLVIAPVLVLFFKLQKAYRASCREAQRLNSITRSPRYAHFKETLTGLTVIRSFNRQDLFLEKYYDTLAENQKMFHGLVSINRWFSVRIPILSAAVSLGVGIGVILLAKQGLLMAGTAGLVLIYALGFWDHLNWAVRNFSEAEANLTSVERLKRFADLKSEPDTTMAKTVGQGDQWPSQGEIVFDDARVRYAPHLPEVLKGVSFIVPGGSKVGFIGRTGAGKSTVFQALYRFIHLSGGEIRIDGCNVNGIPLDRLRRSVAIIPQDPTLFKGDLRDNLDRFEQHSDEAIWEALERVHLGAFIRNLEGGLMADVSENGHNFSQGQRQLMCLARALLVDAKIIVMDEATASVDVETDELIQATIRSSFADKTMLIIAHRLGTVRDCDMVIELADGQVSQVIKPNESRSTSQRKGASTKSTEPRKQVALVQ
jgi:ABC-type multidrug transport system fused ATPase/permease subunit